jgi:hypothetical protein
MRCRDRESPIPFRTGKATKARVGAKRFRNYCTVWLLVAPKGRTFSQFLNVYVGQTTQNLQRLFGFFAARGRVFLGGLEREKGASHHYCKASNFMF